jgi:hypothetical protein
MTTLLHAPIGCTAARHCCKALHLDRVPVCTTCASAAAWRSLRGKKLVHVCIPCRTAPNGRSPQELCAVCVRVRRIRKLSPFMSWRSFASCLAHPRTWRNEESGRRALVDTLVKRASERFPHLHLSIQQEETVRRPRTGGLGLQSFIRGKSALSPAKPAYAQQGQVISQSAKHRSPQAPATYGNAQDVNTRIALRADVHPGCCVCRCPSSVLRCTVLTGCGS